MTLTLRYISQPELISMPERRVALIPLTMPRTRIQQVLPPAIEELRSVLAAQQIAATDALYLHHLEVDPHTFHFEAGFPVARSIEPVGRVLSGLWPALQMARTVYAGPYDGILQAWTEFTEWASQEGPRPPDATCYEIYTIGPETSSNPAEWRTELLLPISPDSSSFSSTDSSLAREGRTA